MSVVLTYSTFPATNISSQQRHGPHVPRRFEGQICTHQAQIPSPPSPKLPSKKSGSGTSPCTAYKEAYERNFFEQLAKGNVDCTSDPAFEWSDSPLYIPLRALGDLCDSPFSLNQLKQFCPQQESAKPDTIFRFNLGHPNKEATEAEINAVAEALAKEIEATAEARKGEGKGKGKATDVWTSESTTRKAPSLLHSFATNFQGRRVEGFQAKMTTKDYDPFF